MRSKLLFILCLFFGLTGFAQVEIPRSTNTGPIIKAEESTSTGFPIFRKEERETNSRFLREKPKSIDLRENPKGLITEAEVMEKKWARDNEIKDAFKIDQSLGNVVTKGRFVEVYCRDHQFIDGDVVKIIVNGEIVAESVRLNAGFTPVLVNLQDGFNSIEFVALTPTAPITSPLSFFRITPPGKLIRPSFECSILKRDSPGCDNLPISPEFMSKYRAVLAFFIAISTDPNHAPSILTKATRFAPASTTAIFILVSISFAFFLEAEIIFSAFSKLTFIKL